MATFPISAEWLLKVYLEGVTVTNDEGKQFSRALYDHGIRSAVERIEAQCSIRLAPRVVSERHDRFDAMGREFSHLKAMERPMYLDGSQPLEMAFMLGHRPLFLVPEDWINCNDEKAGIVELIPVSTNLATLPATQGGNWLGVFNEGVGGRFPGWFRLKYTAGFPVGDLRLLHYAVLDLTETYERRMDVMQAPDGSRTRIGHRADTRGVPAIHLAADTANSLTLHGGTLWYDVSTATEADLYRQINAYKAAFNLHILSLTAHGVTDAVNELISPDATDVTTAANLINEALANTQEHLDTAGSVHGQSDTQRAISWGFVRDDYIQLPEMIRAAIAMTAGILALDPAGDIIAGAGIATKSLSIDQISQSVGTTASATNAGLGARILSWGKQLKPIMQAIRGEYRGMMFRA